MKIETEFTAIDRTIYREVDRHFNAYRKAISEAFDADGDLADAVQRVHGEHCNDAVQGWLAKANLKLAGALEDLAEAERISRRGRNGPGPA